MDAAELHRRAVAEFAARMDEVGSTGLAPDALAEPTPCTDWTVRQLINHVVNEDRWTAPLLAGQTIAEIGDAFDGDLLGDDPVGAFAAAGTEATEASALVDPAQIVHLSYGDVSAREYLNQLAADHLVHAWDLAAATGADRHFDEAVVAAVADWFTEREAAYRQAGATGPRIGGVSDDPQDRLLAAFGRDPSWHPRN
jgi:uncharacterized protein (TIGR03086 family)